MNIFVNYKPSIACLFTHQTVWNYLFKGNDSGRDVYECEYCKQYFTYPTSKEDFPVYKK